MKPGDQCQWKGAELFPTKQMYFTESTKMPAGGSALIIALDYFDMLGDNGNIRVDMAFILVKDCLGWAPRNWLENEA